MASKMVFMRRRIDLDLHSLLSDPDPQSVTTRTFLGADLGVSCAFLNFRIEPLEGPLRGASIALTLKATANYPYEPPQVYAHDRAFLHPNKDPATNRLMFSFVDPQYWKPIFELRQVLCALDMVLLTPDLGYASLKNLDYIRHALRQPRDMEEEGRADAGERGTHSLVATCAFENWTHGFQSDDRNQLTKNCVRVNIGGLGTHSPHNY